MPPILSIDSVSKTYGNHEALRDISFDIPHDSIFGLLGPNGAGKTTLIRIITQIIMADRGDILFHDRPITPEDVRKIGYLPEERGLYKKMKVAEQLLYLAQLKGMPRAEAVSVINAWLDRFDIRSWINKKVQDLSKGMQQKIQFIAAVLHEPSLLILDEPFSGFDPVNANVIKEEILRLKENGTTIIFSTHRMESVEELCDHIAMINKSQIVLNGSVSEIKDQFRDRTYVIDHIGELLSGSSGSVLKTSTLEGDLYRSIIQLEEGLSLNDLIRELISHIEIEAINEKVPSINDIFISQVSATDHE